MSQYGAMANFKIALRELPDHGKFRVTVRAAKFLDALLLDSGTDPQLEPTQGAITITELSEPQTIDISILDLSGRVVRSIKPKLIGGQYVRPPLENRVTRAPGYWDGKDDEGNTVPPGIYLVRVVARFDRGDETRVRPVAVAY